MVFMVDREGFEPVITVSKSHVFYQLNYRSIAVYSTITNVAITAQINAAPVALGVIYAIATTVAQTPTIAKYFILNPLVSLFGSVSRIRT